MQIGFGIPIGGPMATPENLTRLCQAAEAMGYDYGTLSDHVIIPTAVGAKYPYTETGEFAIGARTERHEQLVAAMFVTAVTQKLRVVTSVMVVPHRPAVLAGKMISSIDVLSGGRLTLGIGAGWMVEEFEALQLPDFAARGRVTDEYIAAFRTLWTQPEPAFSGEFIRFGNLTCSPKPVQGEIPIWVGGESGPALRRAARLGNGWYPIVTNPSHPLNSLPLYQAAAGRLRKLVTDAGRKPGDVALAVRAQNTGAALAATASDGNRQLFSGDAAGIAGDLRALKAMGVAAFDLTFPGGTVEEMLAAMQAFRTDVLAKI